MRPLKYKLFWLGLGWAYAGLIIYMSLMDQPPRVADFEQSDKLKHFGAYALLLYYFAQIIENPGLLRRHAWGFVLMGALLEVLQGLGGVRSMELADAAANSLGIAAGGWLGRRWPLYRPLLLRLGLLALSSLSLSCAHKPEQVFKYEASLMHTLWDFSIVARDEALAKKAQALAKAEIERLDQALAMWRPESELAHFNSKAGFGPQLVSPDLEEVFRLGSSVSALSGGASDCTVGPLVQLWYDSLKAKRLPGQDKISRALKAVDYRGLKMEREGLWSLPKGARADLGSLAKGYAQDKAAAIFRSQGIKSFLMNAGGQVYAAGRKPGGAKWKVGIMNPRDKAKIAAVRELEDQGMSTSGDYEQFHIIHGKRYHHILDPRTGWPLAHGVASVTVILDFKDHPMAGSWCDALDTAALVLGLEKGKSLLESQQASGVFIKVDAKENLSAETTADLDGKIEFFF